MSAQKVQYEFVEETQNKWFGDYPVSYLSKLNFIDTVKNVIVNTFDVFKNNPYLEIEAPILSTTRFSFHGHYRYYDVSSYNFESELFSELHRTIDLGSMLGLSCTIDTTSSKGDYFAIVYSIAMSDTNYIASKNYSLATVFVFDKYGKIVHKINNKNIDCKSPEISSDGKYLVCQYQSNKGTDEIIQDGYQIIDLSNDSVVLTKEGNVAAISFYHGFVCIYIDKGEDIYDLYVLESNKDVLLKRRMYMKKEIFIIKPNRLIGQIINDNEEIIGFDDFFSDSIKLK